MDWPLTGRATLMRRLEAALDRDTIGGLALVGRQGVGKTRLAAELGRVAVARGRAVDRIAASPSAASIPFGAVSHLLSLPTQVTDRSWLMTTLVGELRRRGNDKGPLVLIVDDAHHLDDQSAALIHQLAQHQLVALILTERSGESLPDALIQLWKDRLAERMEVGPLTRQATGELVEAALEGPVDALTQAELWQRSAGYPLFLRELVLGGLESGALLRIGDQWHASPQWAPSSRLTELVNLRLGRLEPAQRDAVEALAIAATIELQFLEALGGRDTVAVLEERQLIELDRSGNRTTVRFAHPIYSEVLVAGMPRARARRIMRTLADGLAAGGARRQEDLLKLALWRLDGGGVGEPAIFLAAAKRALAAFDAPLAERLVRAVIASNERGVEAWQTLGQALADQQRIGEAEEVLLEAAQRARSDDAIAQAALARANLLYFRAGRTAEAAQLLADALERIGDTGWRDEIESLLTLFRSAAGQLRAVAAAGRRMVRRRDARPRAVVHTLAYSSIANVMLGRFAVAREEARVGLEQAPSASDELPLMGQMLRINDMMALAYSGQPIPALQLARDGLRGALDARVPELAAMWGMNLAECHILAGEIESGLHEMLGALAIARRRDPFSVHGIDAAVSSICAAWLGRRVLAAALRQEVLDLNLARDVRSRIWLDRATVWTAWHESGQEQAARLAIAAGRQAVADTHLVWAAFIFHDAARLGLAEPAAEHLAGLAQRVEGDFVSTFALHARALADGDAVGLERVASAFDHIGSRLYAAEAAAQAHQQYLRRGRLRLARVAGARASFLASRCPGVQTPALADAAPVPLTERELQIARLAARGTSSRQLAELLEISVRTVDNHLGTIYSKLGIGGRADLPTVLGIEALTRTGVDGGG